LLDSFNFISFFTSGRLQKTLKLSTVTQQFLKKKIFKALLLGTSDKKVKQRKAARIFTS
jgi:hypothetical protein